VTDLIFALDAAGVLVLAAVLVTGGLFVRRRLLQREGGTFDCSLRLRPSGGSGGWALGLARYQPESLEWYRALSFSLRPRQVLPRRAVTVRQRRWPQGAEAFTLLTGSVVVEIGDGGGRGEGVELAMSEAAFTGLLAWLEAAPPGVPLGPI
jgi:hypothetical protein